MAINLATKYSDKIAEKFTHESIVQGKCSTEWDFSGVKTIVIYTPQTVPYEDYTRSGTSRYGTPTDMQDTIQELSMTQDKSFSLVIDKGNNSEQMMIKNAGKMMALQTKEQAVPMVDKYALSVFANKAGKIVASSNALTPTRNTATDKNSVLSAIMDAETYMTDNLVPEGNRYLYIAGKTYNILRQADEYLKLEGTGVKAIEKGVVGEIAGFKVVKVPTSYLPTGVNFIACYKNAVLLPYKIKDAKIHQDPPGISGALLEGRSLFDAFVIGERANGIYVHAYTGSGGASVQATPAVAISSHAVTITSEGATEIKYTNDGSDPRYSPTAETYSSDAKPTTVAGQTIRAYAIKTGSLPSGIGEATDA